MANAERFSAFIKAVRKREARERWPEIQARLEGGIRAIRPPLGPEETSILESAVALLRTWNEVADIDASIAIRSWADWRIHIGAKSPQELKVALLRHLPASSQVQAVARQAAAESTDRSLVEALLEGGVLKQSDLKKLAKSQSGQFLKSAALDVFLDRGGVLPPGLWRTLAVIDSRPEGLLDVAGVALAAFQNDRGRNSSQDLLKYLCKRPTIRAALFALMTQHGAVTNRFAWNFAGDWLAARPSAPREELASLLKDFIEEIRRRLQSASYCEPGLSDSLATLRLMLGAGARQVIPRFSFPVGGEAIDEPIRRATIDLSARALDLVDTGGASADGGYLVALTGAELHTVATSFIDRLTRATAAEGDSAGREAALAKFFGVRDVILDLIPFLDNSALHPQAHRAIEQAVHNAGVQVIGPASAQAVFDPAKHEAEGHGILRGEPVTIRQVGYALSSNNVLVVLRKAKIVPMEQAQ